MTMHRAAAAVAAGGLAVAGVTACSAGITGPSGNSSSSNPPSSSGSPPAAHGDSKVSLGGQLGSFPLPPGASVTTKIISEPGDILVLSGVKAGPAASFYSSALPGDGYKISDNITGNSGTVIVFTGHGYRGGVFGATGTSSQLPSSVSSLGFGHMSTPQLSGNQIAVILKPS